METFLNRMSSVYPSERLDWCSHHWHPPPLAGAGCAGGSAWDGPVGSVWVKDAPDHNFLAITSLGGEIQEGSKRDMEDNSTMFVRRRE